MVFSVSEILPAGYNSWENNGDEVDGPGANEPIWPMLFDTFFPLGPFILTDEMTSFFDTQCPDYVVPCENNTIVISPEFSVLVIREAA